MTEEADIELSDDALILIMNLGVQAFRCHECDIGCQLISKRTQKIPECPFGKSEQNFIKGIFTPNGIKWPSQNRQNNEP